MSIAGIYVESGCTAISLHICTGLICPYVFGFQFEIDIFAIWRHGWTSLILSNKPCPNVLFLDNAKHRLKSECSNADGDPHLRWM